MTKNLYFKEAGYTFMARVSPDGFGFYEYSLYETFPKEHWWSSGKRLVGHGIIWNDIKAEIEERIKNVIELEETYNSLHKQFEEL